MTGQGRYLERRRPRLGLLGGVWVGREGMLRREQRLSRTEVVYWSSDKIFMRIVRKRRSSSGQRG